MGPERDVTGITTYADIADRLGELRRMAGTPSYTQIVRRVRNVRAARGVPAEQQMPGRVTVYDCFKRDRRRFDVDLVVDIARALGVEGHDVGEWERTCWGVQNHLDESRIVHVRTELPEPPLRFVGRLPELATLTGPGNGQVHVVQGMAGSGKTELVCEAARRLLDAGEAAFVVYADLRGFTADRPACDPAAMFDAIVRVLDGDPYRMPSADHERRRVYSSLLAKRKALLILDDARSAAQVKPLLPDHPDGRVFVTSRVTMAGELGVGAVDMGVLAPDDAADFLDAVAGTVTADWCRDDLVGLAEAVGYLPLALSVLGSRIVRRPGWSAADQAQSLIGRRGELRLDDSVANALDRSHASLGPEACRVLRLLAAQPFSDLGRDSVAAAIGVDITYAASLTDELVTASLLTRPGPDRLGMHALVRAHACERSLDDDRPGDRAVVLAAVVNHLVAMARVAAIAAVPGRVNAARYPVGEGLVALDEAAALVWLDAEFENLLVATGPEARAVRPSVAIELAESVSWYVDRSSRHRDGVIMFDRAIVAARALGDSQGEGRAEIARGQSCIRLGELDRAALSTRRAEALVANDSADLARVKLALAALAFHSADLEVSLAYLLEAAALGDKHGDPSDLARTHGNIGVLHSRLGDFDSAVEQLRRAAAYATEAGDMESAAYIWMNTSGTHLRRSDASAALEAAERSLAICEQHGVRSVSVVAGNNRAAALAELGRIDEAIDQAERALGDARQLADQYGEVDVLINLGGIQLCAGHPEDAARQLDAAEALASRLDDDYQRGRALAARGHLAEACGDGEAAAADWSAALDVFDDASPEAAAVRRALEAASEATPD